MWTYIKDSFTEAFEDVGYNAKRTGALFFGKAGAHELPAILGGLTGVSSGLLGPTTATLLVVPSIAAVSAAVVQYDHLHRIERVRKEYADEISALTGKRKEEVTATDLERIAKGDLKAGIRGNAVLKDAIRQSRVERNASIVASAIASVGAYGMVHWFEHAAHTGGAVSAMIGAGSLEGAAVGAGMLLLNAAVGLASYFVIKTPLHAIGGKLLGLEKETAQQLIYNLRRDREYGKTITPEQVFEVHLEAKAELRAQVKESYGKPYEKLAPQMRAEVVERMDAQLKLSETADAINRGEKRPEELAFEVEGQRSGVKPGREKTGVAAKLGEIWQKLSQWKEQGVPMASVELPGETLVSVYTPDANTAAVQVENHSEEPGMRRSYQAMVGRKVSEDGLTHVERYASSKQIIQLG